jgi:hypothetical protein
VRREKERKERGGKIEKWPKTSSAFRRIIKFFPELV